MAYSVVMPALEMAQETGKLLSWRKKEGERVVKGEPLLDIETDKAVVEIESPAEGTLAGVVANAGDVIPVGQTIAWIVGPGEIPPTNPTPPATGRRMDVQAASSAPSLANAPVQSTPPVARISPKARRLAKEHGIDLSGVRGTGGEGEILADDILTLVSSATSPVAATAPATIENLSQIARLMAERTTQSWTTAPHFFVVREVDAGRLLEARERLGSEIEGSQNVRITVTDLIVVLVARVLRKHPRLNASWTEDAIRVNQDVNVAIAMAVNDGVVTAVIPGADTKNLGEISSLRRDMTERARANRLRQTDISGATFTISNLGMYQVDAFTAIIVPQQAAILAVGGIVDRVVPVAGKPGIRPMMTLTLSCDHRVVDGARAAEFMKGLAGAINEPYEWLPINAAERPRV
jgi:pyruvate dehydrogenase E2 component (dihydrolipoamide acetyltransferase)